MMTWEGRLNENKGDLHTLPQKSYQTILRQVISAGMAEFQRPTSGLLLSSVSAGLDCGFSVLLMGVMLTQFGGVASPPVTHLLVANMYAVGFILVILGRSELYTEHTALAVLPVIAGKQGLADLARVWAVVFSGNIAGACAFAVLTAWISPAMGIVEPAAFVHLARGLTDHPWWVILLSAVLAGWLMGELAWLIAAGRDTVSQILCVWLVTAGIGLAELHHVVVGTVEVLAGVLSSAQLGWTDLVRFLFLAAVGNAVGGVFFVAIIKYSHAVRASDYESRA
jgi:formate/nitrite transporter FocA (FNT family)